MTTPTPQTARLWSLGLALALAACSSQPPAPDWQMNAHGAAQKAVQAYLSGETRVATLEFARARQETARTGQPALLAQVHLLECAAQVASLELTPCSAFDTLRPDASAAQTAYADYLAGTLAPQAAALLPHPENYVPGHPMAGSEVNGIEGEANLENNRDCAEMRIPDGKLGDDHWRIIYYLRDAWQVQRRIPTIYETCENCDLDLDRFEALFPDGYHRGALKIAGLRFVK